MTSCLNKELVFSINVSTLQTLWLYPNLPFGQKNIILLKVIFRKSLPRKQSTIVLNIKHIKTQTELEERKMPVMPSMQPSWPSYQMQDRCCTVLFFFKLSICLVHTCSAVSCVPCLDAASVWACCWHFPSTEWLISLESELAFSFHPLHLIV